jgi:hypothetical protein
MRYATHCLQTATDKAKAAALEHQRQQHARELARAKVQRGLLLTTSPANPDDRRSEEDLTACLRSRNAGDTQRAKSGVGEAARQASEQVLILSLFISISLSLSLSLSLSECNVLHGLSLSFSFWCSHGRSCHRRPSEHPRGPLRPRRCARHATLPVFMDSVDSSPNWLM